MTIIALASDGEEKSPKTLPVSTNWLMSPYAGWFFLNHNWSIKTKNFSILANVSDPMNPVAYVSQVCIFFEE